MTCPHCQEEHPTRGYFCPQNGFPVALKPGARGRPRLDDKYELVRTVGEGAMGMVYVARHLRLGKSFALKLLRPDLLSSEEMRRRFEQEARAASGIGHPHIVEVTDLGQSPEGFLYLVMEMLTGRTLGDALEDGKLGVARAIDITCQILDGLEAAHARRVVHRDLKPENVFLCSRFDREDFVKVLDFGIARCFDDPQAMRLTQTGLVMGTPHYMAPEQARGQEADQRVDVYATGVMLYEMITGEQPFVGANYNAVMVEVIKGEFPSPRELAPEIPVEVEAVVLCAMALDPTKRFQSAARFREALEGMAEEVVIDAPAVAAPAPRREARPRQGRAWEASTRAAAVSEGHSGFATERVEALPSPAAGDGWEFPSDQPLESVPLDEELSRNRFAGGAAAAAVDHDDDALPAPVHELHLEGSGDAWRGRAESRATVKPGPSIRGGTEAGVVMRSGNERVTWRRHLVWLFAIVIVAALWRPGLELFRQLFPEVTPAAAGHDAGATIPVVLELSPADTVVILDGVQIQRLPLAVPRDGRRRHLLFAAPGYLSREVTFVADEPQRFSIQLQHDGPRPRR